MEKNSQESKAVNKLKNRSYQNEVLSGGRESIYMNDQFSEK